MPENQANSAPASPADRVKAGAQKLSNNPVIAYFQGARREFQKVVWPTRQQAVNHTLMVVGVSIAVALFLGLVDYLLNFGLESVL